MVPNDMHSSPSRAQLAATFGIVVVSLTALVAARFARATAPELELLLGFVIIGGLSLIVIDLLRTRTERSAEEASQVPVPPRAPATSMETRVNRGSRSDGTTAASDPAAMATFMASPVVVQNIIDGIGIGIMACGPRGELTIFNHAARELHGIPGSASLNGSFGSHYDLYARDGVTLLSPDEAPLARALRGETLQNEELMIASRNGWARTIVVNARPMLDEQGLALGAFATVEDVTERHRTEQDLRAELERAKESDRLKSAFLANMSHEVRTPLNIILGYNTMIAEHFNEAGDTSQKPLLDSIERACRRLMNTVHAILDISRIEVGVFEIHPVALKPARVIEQIALDYEDSAAAKGIVLKCEFEERDATILFDEHCLKRTVEQLFDNAIKFTDKGGVTARLYRDGGGTLTLDVRDTGVGIDPKYVPFLFHAFSQEDTSYTRKFEGSGLGLALVKSYLEFNNAAISVESEKGQGSIFRIRFSKEIRHRPAAVQEATVEDATKPQPVVEDPSRPTVLVVEDDTETQGYMKALLGRRYDVLVAASADEARHHLAEGGDKIRIILMDLSLKGDEDGLMLTRSLRQHPHWKEVAVIATTAHAFLEDQNRALAAGCDAFLAKPFGRDELFATMEKLLA